MNGYRLTRAAALTALVLACVVVAPALAEDPADDAKAAFQRGAQGISLRAGYAKAGGDVAPDGLLGCGFGYRRFVLNGWSVGGFAQYDLLGRFGKAADISVPLTIEVVRHGEWGAAVFPYVGMGGGVFYSKQYRTGQDLSAFGAGRYVTLGAQTPVRKRGLLGLDVRMAFVDKPDDNPSFPGPDAGRLKVDDLLVLLQDKAAQETLVIFNDNDSKTRLLWSVKLDYTITY